MEHRQEKWRYEHGGDRWGNDGLVTVQSAKWGEFLGILEECDHWELRGARGIELDLWSAGSTGSNSDGFGKFFLDFALGGFARLLLRRSFVRFVLKFPKTEVLLHRVLISKDRGNEDKNLPSTSP